MKKIIITLVTILALMSVGCSPGTPGCADKEVQETLIKIIRNEFVQSITFKEVYPMYKEQLEKDMEADRCLDGSPEQQRDNDIEHQQRVRFDEYDKNRPFGVVVKPISEYRFRPELTGNPQKCEERYLHMKIFNKMAVNKYAGNRLIAELPAILKTPVKNTQDMDYENLDSFKGQPGYESLRDLLQNSIDLTRNRLEKAKYTVSDIRTMSKDDTAKLCVCAAKVVCSSEEVKGDISRIHTYTAQRTASGDILVSVKR